MDIEGRYSGLMYGNGTRGVTSTDMQCMVGGILVGIPPQGVYVGMFE